MKKQKINKKRSKNIFVFLIVGIFILIGLGVVSAVECGVTPTDGCEVTVSTTFNTGTYSLNASSGWAILLDGDNIILDCNGSSLIGNRTVGSFGIYEDFSVKINITVKNCNLDSYDYGMNFLETPNLTVINNIINDSITYGIRIRRSYGTNIVANNSFYYTTQLTNEGSDIDISRTNRTIVENNKIYDGHQRGIYIEDDTEVGSNNNIVRHNIINNSYQNGIETYRNSNNNSIYNNTITNPGHNGINIRSFNNHVYNNTIEYANHHGIDLFSCVGNDLGAGNNLVEYNTVNYQNDSHFIYVCNSSNNIVQYNTFFNQTGTDNYGIFISHEVGSQSDNNQFIGNNIINTILDYVFLGVGLNNSFSDNSFSGTGNDWFKFTSKVNTSGSFSGNNNNLDFSFDQFHGLYNHTNDFDYFINNNATETFQLNLFNLTNALIYYSNNSIAGISNIQDNDGSINITLLPSSFSYVLDNYNITIDSSRENDPIYNGIFINNTLEEVTFKVYGGIPALSSGLFTDGTRLSDTEFTIPNGNFATLS